MLRNIIELSDGTRISSGSGAQYAIKSCTVTECVNSGKELTLGSTCSACLEATIITKGTVLSLPAGGLIKLYKADDVGRETQVGVFRMERPTKKSDNVYKITAYDRIVDLDKDLSQWLKEFTNWGCTLLEFAAAVCRACGLTLTNTELTNGSLAVSKFYKPGVTGRRLMKWIGEIACSFCRTDTNGDIEFGWYRTTGIEIRPTGDRYYFAGALTYEDYEVALIDGARVRLPKGDVDVLWPSVDADNPYIITDNPLLPRRVLTHLLTCMMTIQNKLMVFGSYRPCKVSLPASLDIRAGDKVKIVDKDGVEFTTCVMTKIQSGQRDTLECTGSANRDCSEAFNNLTPDKVAQQAMAERLSGDPLIINGKVVSWKDNGDGTFTMIGTEVTYESNE